MSDEPIRLAGDGGKDELPQKIHPSQYPPAVHSLPMETTEHAVK
jgi:hypothetical protein